MAASAPGSRGWRTVLLAVALLVVAEPAPAQLLPWEVTVAEIEAGRLRNLAQRLSKQNLLYQLRLGDVQKADLVETSKQIDRVVEALATGSPAYSVPAPWTPALRAQVRRVEDVWGPLRTVAMASPYDYFRVTRQFMPAENRLGDPLLLRYFDDRSEALVAESVKLVDLYHEQCEATGLEVCSAARTSGQAAMFIERATKEAIFIVAGLDVDRNREQLKVSLEGYEEQRRWNNQSPFFAAALDPERGPNAQAAGQLLASLRDDWDAMSVQFAMLAAGDEQNFDLATLLRIQSRLVAKVERLTAALVRYASATYGS